MEHLDLSSNSVIDWLSSITAPFAVASDASISSLRERWLDVMAGNWITLNGEEMSDQVSSYRILAKAFQFPDYFGNNLNALKDCLTDSDVLQREAFVVQILNASSVLINEHPDALQGLIETFVIVAEEFATPVNLGEAWDRPSIPFHLILCGVGTDPRFADYPFLFSSGNHFIF
jgi:RNAse (barnase) inhibitor barstar